MAEIQSNKDRQTEKGWEGRTEEWQIYRVTRTKTDTRRNAGKAGKTNGRDTE